MTPRHSSFAAFLTFGVCIGLWSGSVPTVVLRCGVTAEQFGAATTGFIAGTILGIATGGLLARRLPLRRTLIAGFVLLTATAALALQAQTAFGFVTMTLLFGYLSGFCDGTMNAEATAVERDLGRPVLAGFHAAASFASAPAAALGAAVSVAAGTGATGGIAVFCAALGLAVMAAAMPLRPVEQRRTVGADPGRRGYVLPLVLIGLIAGISMTGEAAALMFAASTIREQAPALAAYAGLGVSAFFLFQALARAVVDRVRRHVADTDIILWSAALAGIGCLIVATGGTALQSAAGFAVIGIGTAAIVPCSYAIAPRMSGLGAAQAIGLVGLVSALPRVPQPLGFGALAGAHGYAAAYGLNAALLCVAFGLALTLRRTVVRRA